jgi:hypothetical protein
MRNIMISASCSPAVASCRAKYDDDFRVPALLGAQPLDHSARVVSRNIGMVVEPEKGGQIARGRIQFALPVRAKTRRQTITLDGTPGLLCQEQSWPAPNGHFPLQDFFKNIQVKKRTK